MSNAKTALTAMAISIAPVSVWAHPGHGTLSGLLHGFEPVHALPLLAIGALGIWLYRRARKA